MAEGGTSADRLRMEPWIAAFITLSIYDGSRDPDKQAESVKAQMPLALSW